MSASLSSPLGYEQITDLSASTDLTPPAGATVALIVVEAQDVRWRDDGTDPTDTVGMPLAAGQSMVYDGSLSAIEFIEVTSGAALNVAYY